VLCIVLQHLRNQQVQREVRNGMPLCHFAPRCCYIRSPSLLIMQAMMFILLLFRRVARRDDTRHSAGMSGVA